MKKLSSETDFFKLCKSKMSFTYKQLSECSGLSEQTLKRIFNNKQPARTSEQEQILDGFGFQSKRKKLTPLSHQMYFLSDDEIGALTLIVDSLIKNRM